MSQKVLIIVITILFAFSSCRGNSAKIKRQLINNRISKMRSETDSVQKAVKHQSIKTDSLLNKDSSLKKQFKSMIPEREPGDSIVGNWEVNNNYCMAIYEIIKFKDQYLGKIHYFNDGKNEIRAQNNDNDYFLYSISYKEGKYTNGKMYMPDGKQHIVNIILKGDELTISMTINGLPYREKWKRKVYDLKNR